MSVPEELARREERLAAIESPFAKPAQVHRQGFVLLAGAGGDDLLCGLLRCEQRGLNFLFELGPDDFGEFLQTYRHWSPGRNDPTDSRSQETTRTDTSIREGPEEPLINPVPGTVSYICTRKIAAREWPRRSAVTMKPSSRSIQPASMRGFFGRGILAGSFRKVSAQLSSPRRRYR